MFAIWMWLYWKIYEPLCRCPSLCGDQVTVKSEIESGNSLKAFLCSFLEFLIVNVTLTFSRDLI